MKIAKEGRVFVYPLLFLTMILTIVSYLYNINGILEKKIFDGMQQAGVYNIEWDANTFSSGIYFIQLQANGNMGKQIVIFIK